MNEKITEYWSCYESCESLHCQSEYEAIDDFLDDEAGVIKIDEESTVDIYRFVPVKPSLNHVEILDDVLDRLDENFMSEYDDAQLRTPKMIDAARAFADAILSEYKTDACENVGKKTINLYEWCREHKPELIK